MNSDCSYYSEALKKKKNVSCLQFDRAVRLFGEDNSTIQPDDFFAIFDSFLTALSEARQDNITVKKRREEEEKRTRQEIEVCINVCFFFFL